MWLWAPTISGNFGPWVDNSIVRHSWINLSDMIVVNNEIYVAQFAKKNPKLTQVSKNVIKKLIGTQAYNKCLK
jgi:hypothetical protein